MTEIFDLALVFELQLWREISFLFFFFFFLLYIYIYIYTHTHTHTHTHTLNVWSLSSKVGYTLSGHRNSHTMMKSCDRLSLLQVFVTWSVKFLPVNSLQFLLSVVQKRSCC